MSGQRTRHREEDGFTLIELLIVCILLPIVAGAISVAIISVLSLQSGVSSRLSDSADAQIVSATFVKDVHSALNVTTSTAGGATQCGTGTPLLGLEWGLDQLGVPTYLTVVSYYKVQSGSTYVLVRKYCAGGASPTATTISTLSSDVGASSSQVTATVAPVASGTAASGGWTTSQAITGVTLVVYEPGSKYTYSLVALPQAYSAQTQPSVIATPTSGCGFATPGTGTYAGTLCFVDFTGYNSALAQVTLPGCQTMTRAIARTPYVISFCINVAQGTTANCALCGTVAPFPIPTYYGAPTSEAFLGNNGFYTDIPGDPALYQTTPTPSGGHQQTTTVTITNITVLDANDNAATGWDLVTGDAESTDGCTSPLPASQSCQGPDNESLTWTSNVNLSLLPNNPPISQFGNACAAPTAANPAAVWLTGLGTPTVTCSATVQSDKTGTVMLQALTPSSLTVTMVGNGNQAMFLGLLLP